MNGVVVRCIIKHESESKFSYTEHKVQYKEYPVQLNTSEYNVTSIICPVCRKEVTFMVLPPLPFGDAISVGFKAMKRKLLPFAVYIPLFWLDALKPLRFKIGLVETEAYKHFVFYHRRNVGLSGGYDSELTEARIEYYLRGVRSTEKDKHHKEEEPGTKAKSMLKPKLDTLKAQRDFEGLIKAHALDQLLDLLHNDDRHIQERAATALGEVDDITAVPHLIRAAMLHSHLNECVIAAIERLHWKPAEDSLGGAFMLLKLPQEDYPRRDDLGNMVMRVGQLSVFPLIATLSDKEIPSKWRILAGNVLSTIGDTRAVVPLVEVLRERNLAGEKLGGTTLRLAALLHLIRFKKEAIGPVNGLLGEAIQQQNEDLQSDCITIVTNIAKITQETTEQPDL